ncbi:hypothetical protein VNI00_010513 [Paramarasmius palmivorus]|uniref:GST N-terminal domain-containing protein n=1 Tax=Paramarasmius palmivorus TaxID=297713 RepID=A0AAW0CKR9_9AGAR
MITLYDLGPSTTGGGYSHNVRRIVYALKYKKIPFTISLVDFLTLEPTAKSVGASPTSKKANGDPQYTVPFIRDSTTGKVVSDSLVIAEYLDETYPDTPRVVPPGTRALQAAYSDWAVDKLFQILPFLEPRMHDIGSPEVKESYKALYGVPTRPPDEEKAAVWDKVQQAFDSVKAGHGEVYVTGDKPIFADFALAGLLWEISLGIGNDSEEWKEIAGWQDGRLGRLLESVEKYV